MVDLKHPLGLIAVYLAVTFPPLVMGPWTVGHASLTAVHLIAMAAFWWHASRGMERPSWVYWLAVAMIPLMYTEIAQLNQLIGSGYHDPLIMGWESAIFGSPATELAAAIPNIVFSEVLHLCYLLYYPTIFLPPALLYYRRRTRQFEGAVLAVVATAAVCFAIFVYFPVQGPRYFGPPEGVPHGPVRGLTLAILESGSSRGAAFPSSHMAIATAQAMAQLRYHRPMGLIIALITVGIGVGAVYGGFHYAIDMSVGAVVGVVVAGWVLRTGSETPEGDGRVGSTEGEGVRES